MAATFVRAGTATITVDAHDYSCQVVSFDPGWADTEAASSGEKTACGDVVPADDTGVTYPARPVLGIVHDWSTAGVSRVLAGKVGQTVALVVDLDTDQDTQKRRYTGTVIVPPVPDSWRPGALQRTDALTFTAKTWAGPVAVPAP